MHTSRGEEAHCGTSESGEKYKTNRFTRSRLLDEAGHGKRGATRVKAEAYNKTRESLTAEY